MSNKKHVAIIGGGIIGLNTAYYLQQEGHEVTLIDQNKIGNACSAGNAGMIVPSHFIPLAAPGMIAKGIKWMFKPESPFQIKPRLDLDLASWLWQFYKKANAKHVKDSVHIIRDLNNLSKTLFQDIKDTEKLSFDLGHKGLMMLYKTNEVAEDERAVAKMANELGIETKEYNSDNISDVEPNIDLKVKGGIHYPNDAHINPTEFINHLLELVKSRGAKVYENEAILDLETKGDKITKIKSTKREIEADEFVLATGAYSPILAKKLKLNLPVLSGKGYSITLNNVEHQLQTPSILCEAKVAVTPMGKSLRFAGTMELTNQDLSINEAKVRGLLKSIPNYLPQYGLDKTKSEKVWSGLRPCSPDGLPFIGRFNKYNNLIAATGHAMMGVSLGPVTGKLVSELISEKKTSLSLTQLNANRYN